MLNKARNFLKNKMSITLFFFIVIILIFFYRIFLGEVYSPTNLYYHMAPWNGVDSQEGTRGALLSDPIDYYLPHMYYLKDKLFDGGISLWTSNYALGNPVESEVIALLLYPLALWYLILPIEVAITFQIISKLLFALVGMYLFLKELKINKHAACIGALIFTFSLPMIVWLNWPHTNVSVFAPWLLWGLQKVYYGNRKYIILTAFIIAIMLFGNMPAYVGYYLYIGGAYFLFLLIKGYLEKRDLRMFILKGSEFILIILLGVGIASIYVISFLNYINNIGFIEQREGLFNTFFTSKYLLSFISPFYIKELGVGNMHPNEYSGYFGITTLVILGMSAIYTIKSKNLTRYFWTGLIVILWLVIYGNPIAEVFKYLPVVGKSAAIRLIGPLTFLIAIMVAYTLSDIVEKKKKDINNLSIVFSAFFILALYIIATSSIDHSVHLTPSLGMAFIFVFFLVMILSFYHYNLMSSKKFIILLTILFAVDLLKAGIHYNPTVRYDKVDLQPQTETTEFLQSQLNKQRFAAVGVWTLFPNTSSFYQINDVRGHSFIHTNPRHQKFFKAIDESSYISKTRIAFHQISNHSLLSASSMSYILSPEQLDEIIINDNPQLPGMELQPIGEITTGTTIEQSFISKEDNLRAISILFATYKRTFNDESIVFSLLDENDQIIRQTEFLNQQLQDNSFFKIIFEPIKSSKGQFFKIRLTSDAFNGSAATQWVSKNDSYLEGKLNLNNNILEGDMIFNTHFNKDIPYQSIGRKDNLYVYKNPNALPRAYLVTDVMYSNNEDEILANMAAGDIYNRAYIEKPLSQEFQHSKILSKQYTEVDEFNDFGDRIEIKIDISRDMFLVLTDNFFDGWKAYVNGSETEIYRTNYLFKGIYVPEGEHTIKFIYKPPYFNIGLIITIISVMLSIILLYIFYNKDRKFLS
jgi:hypothetical protein